jgi:hypothetical protein
MLWHLRRRQRTMGESMGSDATIYIFDDAAYRERVARGIRRFVQTGVADPWLDDLIRWLAEADWASLDVSFLQALGFSFDVVCDYLDTDFSYTRPEADQLPWAWRARACPSVRCPATNVCPLHRSHKQEAAENFNLLLEACVVDQCLGPGQFLGRTISPLEWYSDTLAAAGFGPKHPVFRYLRRLGCRGAVVGYQFGNSDGIHGWLTSAETREFFALLHGIDLPRVEPSFQAMKEFSRNGTYAAPPPYTFEQLSLSFLRTVSGMAMAEGRGILWGNDVSTY